MRDSLIVIGIFGVLSAGVFSYLHSIKESPASIAALTASTPVSSPSIVPPSSSQNVIPVTNIPGAHKNASTNHRRSKQVRHHGSRPRLTGPVKQVRSSKSDSEDEGFPSLHEAEEVGQQQPKSAVNGNNDSALPEPVTKRSVIPGVDVAAWVSENRNKLKDAKISTDTGSGMRVFLGCVEVKKEGPEYLGEKQCGKLLATDENAYPGKNRY